jgi:hypothetical protein
LAGIKKYHSKYDGYSYWDVQATIRESQYLVKWNPVLAIQWMNEISTRVGSFVEVEYYNNAVQTINRYLDGLEKRRYYIKEEVWGPYNPQRLKLLSDSL